MRSASPHQGMILASGFSAYPIEYALVGFAAFVLILLLLVRVRRAHNQKLRRAASTGFYDFDVAHYGHSTSVSSPTDTLTAPIDRPLAPTFVSSPRGDETKARAAPVAPLPVPASFAQVDHRFVGPLPEFDQHHPPPRPRPPAPSPTSPLPLLEQPPPPTTDSPPD
jgi:hypothetical protein